MKHAFTYIYDHFVWGKGNSSGGGSVPSNARKYLAMLQRLFLETNYRTVVDYGCGNWELMKTIVIAPHIQYLGIDIVKSVIDTNIRRYERPNVHFREIDHQRYSADITADILIIKDVMQHWSNGEIIAFLQNLLPNYRMALITNDFCQWHGNPMDIKAGSARCLDLREPPFSLKAELVMSWIYMATKHVLLWKRDPGDRLAVIRGYSK
jgi:SAM-dependent methyltransferase